MKKRKIDFTYKTLDVVFKDFSGSSFNISDERTEPFIIFDPIGKSSGASIEFYNQDKNLSKLRGGSLKHRIADLFRVKEDELIGAMIISRAILAPLRRIAENAGINGPVIIERVQQQEFEIGYNAADNVFGNMYEEGIVDPAKVTRSGLQNATSIASMILTTECIIVDDIKTLKES